MKIFMIGGTGLLGCEAARIFIERGHEVTSVALPPLPEGAPIPKEMKLEMCNIYEKEAFIKGVSFAVRLFVSALNNSI